jgi:hypothetical protein
MPASRLSWQLYEWLYPLKKKVDAVLRQYKGNVNVNLKLTMDSKSKPISLNLTLEGTPWGKTAIIHLREFADERC